MPPEDPTLVAALEGFRYPRRSGLDDLPPFPTKDLVPLARRPPMPNFCGELAGDTAFCVRAYQAFIHHVEGTRPRIAANKQFFQVRPALLRLHAHNIRHPHAWVRYSYKTWITWHAYKKQKPKRMPLLYAFSAKFIERSAKRYFESESIFMPAQFYMTDAHQELVNLWYQCRKACLAGGAPVKEIVEAILPDTVYTGLQARAAAEVHATEAEYMRRLAKGEWIWE